MERERKEAVYSSRPILSFRASRELMRKIDNQAIKTRKTRAEVILEMLEKYIKSIK